MATVFFDVSYQSYLPALVGREHLVEGNGKLEASSQVAYAGGPAAGGFLVQWLTAPFALAADALTYLWSVVWLARIRTREPVPNPARRAPECCCRCSGWCSPRWARRLGGVPT